jgi:hypothetical protein
MSLSASSEPSPTECHSLQATNHLIQNVIQFNYRTISYRISLTANSEPSPTECHSLQAATHLLQNITHCKQRTISYRMTLSANCGSSSHTVLLPLSEETCCAEHDCTSSKSRALQARFRKRQQRFRLHSVRHGNNLPKLNWTGSNFLKITVHTLQTQTLDVD